MPKPEEKGRTRRSGADNRFILTYILHFDKEVDCEESLLYGDLKHYVGRSTQVEMRILEHVTGYGSIVTRKAFSQGIRMRLIYLCVGDSEKELTDNIKAGLFNCPICDSILLTVT